ncbi:hypothetical protein AB0D38_49000, partial [Streptomyces sp. NPDC048279]|uniref:hypothetical protein n=1 Tax=Streptomyces sp. NPDC048279 TaxID=3154714 RepID=UPI00343B1BF5
MSPRPPCYRSDRDRYLCGIAAHPIGVGPACPVRARIDDMTEDMTEDLTEQLEEPKNAGPLRDVIYGL